LQCDELAYKLRAMADEKQELAETRTDWAEDRTNLANERTFAGWMRTGMASVAVAIGLKAVFGDFDPTWAAKAVATLFIAVALVIFWAARQQACSTLGRLSAQDVSRQGGGKISLIAVMLSLGASATGVILWLL
jgi:putative membrane protein